MALEENFDLSEVKVIDENGEAQPVETPQEEEQPNEALKEAADDLAKETGVEDTSEDETEVKETVSEETEDQPAEQVSEEEQVESDENIGKPEELFQELDNISKDLSDGKANTLEEFFEEYKRMRDSSETQFKDDFIKNAVEYYHANGNLTPYLEATSVNYEEMSDEQVMRRNLIKSNPTLSERNIERLFQRDVIDKYTLDEDKFDEDEVELGKELLKAEAQKLRKDFVDEQNKFTQPPKTEGQETESQDKIIEQWTETVSNHAVTKNMLENKSISVEYGGSKFTYEVENPQDLQDMTVDNNKFFSLFKDENENIDFEKWYKVLAYATNPDVYDSSLIAHGQEMGQEKLVSNMKNTEKPMKSSKEYKTPSNPIEGLIGALSRGDSDVKIIR
jgi:hypothetical protein